MSTNITDCIDSINKRFADVDTKILNSQDEIKVCLDNLRVNLNKDIEDLVKVFNEQFTSMSKRLDWLEREERCCDMVITGIPIIKSNKNADNKNSVFSIFKNICDRIQYPIAENSVVRLFQLRPTTKRKATAPIIIRFARKDFKSKFFSKYKSYGDLKLSCIGYGIESRIYCNDALTRSNSALFYEAKGLEKNKKISKCFTKFGVVHIIPEQDGDAIAIHNTADLKRWTTLANNSIVNDQGNEILDPVNNQSDIPATLDNTTVDTGNENTIIDSHILENAINKVSGPTSNVASGKNKSAAASEKSGRTTRSKVLLSNL